MAPIKFLRAAKFEPLRCWPPCGSCLAGFDDVVAMGEATERRGRHFGVASMLRRIVGFARERGFTRLEADVLESNCGMIGVFDASGLPMTHRSEGNVIHVTMSL